MVCPLRFVIFGLSAALLSVALIMMVASSDGGEDLESCELHDTESSGVDSETPEPRTIRAAFWPKGQSWWRWFISLWTGEFLYRMWGYLKGGANLKAETEQEPNRVVGKKTSDKTTGELVDEPRKVKPACESNSGKGTLEYSALVEPAELDDGGGHGRARAR